MALDYKPEWFTTLVDPLWYDLEEREPWNFDSLNEYDIKQVCKKWRLNKYQTSLILMHILEKLSFKEMAIIVHKPKSTVYLDYQKIKKRLYLEKQTGSDQNTLKNNCGLGRQIDI